MLLDLIIAFLIGGILTAIFAYGFKRTGPWNSLLLFFLIIFIAAWAGGIWLAPFGPPIYGIYWFPFFLVGLIFALVLAATAASSDENFRETGISPSLERRSSHDVIAHSPVDIFFWALIAMFLVTIIVGYVLNPV